MTGNIGYITTEFIEEAFPECQILLLGALSIVRFRTAVKDPMDLLYLFWAITTGITTGAGMYVLALIAAVVMIANVEDITLIQYNGEYHG